MFAPRSLVRHDTIPQSWLPPSADEIIVVREKLNARFVRGTFVHTLAHKVIDFSLRGKIGLAWLCYAALNEKNRRSIRDACAGRYVLFPAA